MTARALLHLALAWTVPCVVLGLACYPAAARETVDASEPTALAVTVYRDPERRQDDQLNINWPRGFAMINETRRVTLPAGHSTIRFSGVAEGMVAVSAIVTGLPGGTIEKNRNAELLSPAALINGMLGNRITVTRTNPGNGVATTQSAIVRTRADGALVLQTEDGLEAIGCAGVPERLTFPAVPAGLSPQPVFTVDTYHDTGDTFDVTLTYLAWGFDWQAHYVATLDEGMDDNNARMRLMSWLTILNDNGQSFADADLMAVAGTLNIETDFEDEAEPPAAERLRLTCYPLGSTAAGSPVPRFDVTARPAPRDELEMMADGAIVVTAARRAPSLQESPVAIKAVEEQLGDLKLYRVPEKVSVNAQGLKQVAFLNQDEVEGRFLYEVFCRSRSDQALSKDGSGAESANIFLVSENEKKRGLGMALPMGGLTLFEPSPDGPLLVAETSLRDYAVGQDIELRLGESGQVYGECAPTKFSEDEPGGWKDMKAVISNANPGRVSVRLDLGRASNVEVKGIGGVKLKDGKRIAEVRVPANGSREITFRLRVTD